MIIDPPISQNTPKYSLSNWLKLKVVRHLQKGGIIAYPTEAVFGLGCDPFNPRAVQRLLALKKRPSAKGVILIVADFGQAADLVKITDSAVLNRILTPRSRPTTWLIPANPSVPSFLRGTHRGLAIRITSHPVASALCRAFDGPLVSTSANLAGFHPATSRLKVRQHFAGSSVLIVPGPLGKEAQPSEIRDAVTGVKLR